MYSSTQGRFSGRAGTSGSRGDTGEEFGGRNNTEEESLAQGSPLKSFSVFVGGGRDEQMERAHMCVLAQSVVSDSLQPHGLQPTRLLCPWDSPGKNSGVGCHCLLQGIFPTQGSNLCLLHLLHWQASSLPLAPPGSSRCVHTHTHTHTHTQHGER